MSTELAIRPVAAIEADIRREFTLAQQALGRSDVSRQEAMAHAINCGHYLQEMRDALPHGNWYGWLEGQWPTTPRTASNYMRLASKSEMVSDMGIAQALKLLAEDNTPPKESTREVTADLKDAIDEPIEATAIEESVDPVLLEFEDAFGRVIQILVEARSMVGESAFDRRSDASRLATDTARALKAYQEKA